LNLKFITKNEYGTNVGSRVYVMQGNAYKMFFLKNREFTFDVDLSTLECGINGALYLVEMPMNGDIGVGYNKAGAHFGTGYCDAQCFLDGKFIGGTANVPLGKNGYCCTEVDIFEANIHSASFTMHTCSNPGADRCSELECGPGDNGDSTRSKGRCDRDGCDWNDYRLGNKTFFGPGAGYQVDTTKPMTITTQFLTNDGTDNGELVEIRRSYQQHGRRIEIPSPSLVDKSASSMTDDFCQKQKTAFGDPPDFQDRGGMKATGDALDRGMVLVMSIWDDSSGAGMDWLDSTFPEVSTEVGAERGACKPSKGNPEQVRKSNPHAYVKFSNIRVGEIGTTDGVVGDVCPGAPINVYQPSVGSLFADTKIKSSDTEQTSSPTPSPPTPSPPTPSPPTPSLRHQVPDTKSSEAGDLFHGVVHAINGSEPTLLSSKIGAKVLAGEGTTVFVRLSTTTLCAVVAGGFLAAAAARWYRAPGSLGTAHLIALEPESSDLSDAL
jgi:cellulose 1,4-beta-cellobiosidase